MIEAGILCDRRVELLAGEQLADYLRSRLTGKVLIREARPTTLADSEPEPDIAVVKSPREQYRERHCHNWKLKRVAHKYATQELSQ